MSEVITALHRLERAGSEESRQTGKLIAAAETLAAALDTLIPDDEACMPRGAQHHAVDFDTEHTPHCRESALALAEAISSGWLGELAAWLEQRGAESAEAAARLERAAEVMR